MRYRPYKDFEQPSLLQRLLSVTVKNIGTFVEVCPSNNLTSATINPSLMLNFAKSVKCKHDLVYTLILAPIPSALHVDTISATVFKE